MERRTLPPTAGPLRNAVLASCIVCSLALQAVLVVSSPPELLKRFFALPTALVVPMVVLVSLLSAASMVELYRRAIAPLPGSGSWSDKKHFSVVVVVWTIVLPVQVWFALTAGRSPL